MIQVHSSKLSYRAEIDGLRAIAVVSVIIYHAQIALFGKVWFEGGFIGVDIFFVISGYLITRIILSELQTKGSFSFINFYERRARRILPMLFIVIFASFPMAWLWLLPKDLVEYSNSILASVFFGSNFFFYFNTTEYGADSALLKPFLHTWSLGVEEQFYLVFPILAILAFKFFRAHFLRIIVALSLLSLLFAQLMEAQNPDLNFYLPFGRFWELAVGSMLAYRELNNKSFGDGLGKRVPPMLGFFLVAYSILFFDEKTPHPSFHTLIPIVGVALIIGFSSKDELVGKVLGSKLFVWIGLISYSAYLWHFPIFAFARTFYTQVTELFSLSLIVLTLIFSVISYRFIEQPFRKQEVVTSKKFFGGALLAASLIILCGFNINSNSGFKNRVPFEVTTASFDDRLAHPEEFLRCHRRQGKEPLPLGSFCELGRGGRRAYLVGDSHMVSIAWQLSSKLENTTLTLMTGPGKIFGLDSNIDEFRLNLLENAKNSLVVFGGYSHSWDSNSDHAKKNKNEFINKQTKAKYTAIISTLLKNNNKVVLIYPVPSIDIGRRGLASEVMTRGHLLEKFVYRSDYDRVSKRSFDFYDSFSFSEVKKVYPHKFLCDESRCYGVRNGDILISDIDHPSIKTADWIATQIVADSFW
ncbi:MAG: acyltransferase family protein [Alcanivoracaceae bacterium]|nr:acyltransferase family protein [Alcanivoracaceae bacterium]